MQCHVKIYGESPDLRVEINNGPVARLRSFQLIGTPNAMPRLILEIDPETLDIEADFDVVPARA